MTRRILLTPGEPAGVGPELAIRAAQKPRDYELVAIASPELLQQSAAQLGLPIQLREITPNEAPQACKTGELAYLPVKLALAAEPGKLKTENAHYVVNALQLANDLCLSSSAHAIVTGPVQKSVINDAGIAFSGHTEFFAEKSKTNKVVMMLATQGLRVALATTHLPLKDVSAAITKESLSEVLCILVQAMQRTFGIDRPRILICGLNPHAGEGGHLGMEEIETIIPTIESLRHLSANLIGPLPADTLFTPRLLNDADAVLAMYHDQGLPVLKYKGFGDAVNITLGLPYIRTSVDHGTALDIAGKGIADMGSIEVALQTAYEMSLNLISH